MSCCWLRVTLQRTTNPHGKLRRWRSSRRQLIGYCSSTSRTLALALDRYWNVIRTNEAAPRFFGSFVDLEARPRPRNLLDLMFDPAGMRPFVEGWEEVAAGLLQRVYRECVGQVVDQKTVEVLNRLEKYPRVKGLSTIPRSHSPVLPITFLRGSERFSYF